MCLVCNDEKILWQAGPAGGLTVGPCPVCNKNKPKNEFQKLEEKVKK